MYGGKPSVEWRGRDSALLSPLLCPRTPGLAVGRSPPPPRGPRHLCTRLPQITSRSTPSFRSLCKCQHSGAAGPDPPVKNSSVPIHHCPAIPCAFAASFSSSPLKPPDGPAVYLWRLSPPCPGWGGSSLGARGFLVFPLLTQVKFLKVKTQLLSKMNGTLAPLNCLKG